MINEHEEDEIVTLAINCKSKVYSSRISNKLSAKIVYHLYRKKNARLKILLEKFRSVESLINNALLQRKEKKALLLLIIQSRIMKRIEGIVE